MGLKDVSCVFCFLPLPFSVWFPWESVWGKSGNHWTYLLLVHLFPYGLKKKKELYRKEKSNCGIYAALRLKLNSGET